MNPYPPGPSSTVHQILDPQHGLVAARFQHPADWQAQSQVVWNFQNYSSPVKVSARIAHPHTAAMVEVWPVEQFCWIEPNMGFYQPGHDVGGGSVLLPPMPAPEAMTRWLIPKLRGNVPGLQIVGAGAMPQLAQMLNVNAASTGGVFEGAGAKVQYVAGGRMLEEEFYGLKVSFQGIPTYGAAGCLTQYNWGLSNLFSVRAERGQLDAQRDVAWAIMQSFKVNPQWEQLLARILQQLQQEFDRYIQAGYAQIEAASQLSRQISAQNAAWLQQQEQQRNAAWQSDQQRRAQDAAARDNYSTNDAFSDMIMGRETYTDPNSSTGSSQHYGYHQYVWTDALGNVQYSDDANYNPNIGSSTQWTLIQQKQIGDRW